MASFQEELAIQNEAIEEANAIKDKIASVARNKVIPVHNGYTQIDVLDKIETNTIPTPVKTLKIYNNDNYDVTNVKTVVVDINLNQKLNEFIMRSSTEYTAEDLSGLSWVGPGVFAYYPHLTSVELPDTVTGIDNYAFYDCGQLTEVIIPEGVSYIGYDSVFANCYNLQHITLPDNLYYIGQAMFSNCYSLTHIDIPSAATEIGASAFAGCSGLTEIALPSGLLMIGTSAFQACTGLTSIIIPENVTSIGAYAFNGCSSLGSINIPDGVTIIDYGIFSGCTGLESVTLGDGVTGIAGSAFSYCTGLTSITIPESVTAIGDWAFGNCESLTTMTVLATTPPELASTTAISDATTTIYIPAGTLADYQNATNWSSFASKFVELDDGNGGEEVQG